MSLVTPTLSLAPTLKARDVEIECCNGCSPCCSRWFGRKVTTPRATSATSQAPTEGPLSLRQVLAQPVPPRKSIAAVRMSSELNILAPIPEHPVKQDSVSPQREGDVRITIHRHEGGTPSISVHTK
jgi:hypothetical protein